MIDQSNIPGMMDGFKWWVGIVEDRKDPEKLSRMQVRMFVWHTDDKALIPTEKLFWAIPVFTTHNSNQTYCAKEGDSVFGFWIDTKDLQQPYIFGRFPDKPAKLYPATKGFSDPGKWMGDRPVEVASRTMRDGEGLIYSDASPRRYPDPLNEQTTSRYARAENLTKTPLIFIRSNIIKGVQGAYGVIWDEVDPDYAPVYPYNDSKQSESGNYVDVDDTRRKERITFTHRTGTMQEMRHTGTIHRKDMHHAVQLVHGTDFKNIRGNLWHTTERFTRYRSKGKTFVELNADTKVGVGEKNNFRMDVGVDTTIRTGNEFNISGIKIKILGKDEVEIHGGKSILLKSPEVIVEGKLIACSIKTNLLEGDVEGNLYGIATDAVNAGVAKASGSVSNGVGHVVFQPPMNIPTCLGQAEYIEPDPPETIDNPEAPIDEIIAKGGEKKDPKADFQARMDAWYAKITAPTGSPGSGGGGAGQDWVYWFPDGTMGGMHTHHATGNGDILTYIWCLGAIAAECTENSTKIKTYYTVPAGFVCPI